MQVEPMFIIKQHNTLDLIEECVSQTISRVLMGEKREPGITNYMLSSNNHCVNAIACCPLVPKDITSTVMRTL